MTATPSTRKAGREVLLERFPEARELWTLAGPDVRPLANQAPQFTVTAFLIDGRVIILQEFADHRAGSWDVYVPASSSNRVDETLDAIAQPAACRSKQCSYYQYYLAYGPAELEHEGYHAAEKMCAEWQKRLSDYFEAHPTHEHGPAALEENCRRWEERVRA